MKDVFLCHVSNDKENIVLPLYSALESSGIKCWLDKAEIKWGDSIVDKVNDGLANSKYLIVILSSQFIEKNWAFRELNSILNKEASSGKVIVLPLLCGSKKEIKNILEYLPIINDKSYLVWKNNPKEVVNAFSNLTSHSDGTNLEKDVSKKSSIILEYGVIGSTCGLLIDEYTDLGNNIEYLYTFIVTGISIVYGYIINTFFGKNIPKLIPTHIWKKFYSENSLHHIIPLLPNIIALPFMGAILGDYLYESYEATIVGMLLALSIGTIVKFKLSSIASAMVWTTFGMFIALEYGVNSDDTYERFQTYGALGALLGIILSLFVGYLIGAVQGLLGSKAKADEATEADEE